MAIRVQGLSHAYNPGTPLEVPTLRDIDLYVPPGAYVAIIGHVGSGKSTLVQHFNGLIRPQKGSVHVLGMDVSSAGRELRRLRQRVGLVFQYPEHQLFAETVFDDIAFGPRNMGLAEEQVAERVRAALSAVNLPEELLHRSPFALSGGQQRRVAIAGVLAMDPEILILDEPAAGLDPRGRKDLFALIESWHRRGRTVILVTHHMADAARYAQRVVVLHHGRVLMQGNPREVFSRGEALVEAGLDVPEVTRFLLGLRARGLPVEGKGLTVEEAAQEVLKLWGGGDSG